MKTVSGKVVLSIGLSIRAQMVGGGCPLLPDIFDQRDAPPSKMAHSSLQCESKKSSPLKFFAIFSLRLSVFQ